MHVSAFTKPGDGVQSSPVFCRTEEDGKISSYFGNQTGNISSILIPNLVGPNKNMLAILQEKLFNFLE